jgi:hypothetical protein
LSGVTDGPAARLAAVPITEMFRLNCGEIRTTTLARLLTSSDTSIDNRAEDRVEDQSEPEIDEKDVA